MTQELLKLFSQVIMVRGAALIIRNKSLSTILEFMLMG